MYRLLRLLPAVSLSLGALVGVPVLSVSGVYSLKYGDCVRLPNGAEIGYEAYINFGNSYFIPDAVLRTSDGDVIAKEVSPIHLTEMAAFGWSWPERDSGEDDFRFIWTRKTGVVKETENPELYMRLSQDLGGTYYGASENMNTNTLWLFQHLLEEGQFKSDRCSTSLLTW